MSELRELKEICASCGRRRGEHYGPGTYKEHPIRTCILHKGKWIKGVPMDYDGTFWAPTGIYENGDRMVDTNSMQFRVSNKGISNPNTMFKIRKRKV